MSKKLLIALVVLLTAAFFVGIGAGLTRDNDDPDLAAADWLESFEALLPNASVSTNDLDSVAPPECLDLGRDELIIAAGDTCSLSITPARGQRLLKLKLVDGASAEIIVRQPVKKDGNRLTSDQRVQPGKWAELDIYRRQTSDDLISAEIRCDLSGDDACRLQFP